MKFREITKKTKIDFMGFRNKMFVLSAVLVLARPFRLRDGIPGQGEPERRFHRRDGAADQVSASPCP